MHNDVGRHGLIDDHSRHRWQRFWQIDRPEAHDTVDGGIG